MASGWYYYQGEEQIGPVEKGEIKKLHQEGKLTGDSYVWKKGMDNWQPLQSIKELSSSDADGPPTPPKVQAKAKVKEKKQKLDWNSMADDHKAIHLKIGHDRGREEQEYGPFSKAQLKRGIFRK